MSEDSIKISNLTMRILFKSGLYSNADSIQDFTVGIRVGIEIGDGYEIGN